MKKRIATTLVAGALAFTSFVGAGTYAYFVDTATSSANTFQAGEIKLVSTREDLPITGPMFYTNDSASGIRGTGLWAPGKENTRVMFITNDGSVPAKLSNIKAELTNSGDFSDAEKAAFLNDMNVGIWATKTLARDHHDGSHNQQQMTQDVQDLVDALQDAQNELDIKTGAGGSLETATEEEIMDEMESLYRDAVRNKNLPAEDIEYIVSDHTKLGTFTDPNSINVSRKQPTLAPGESIAFVYEAKLTETRNDQNILQDKSFMFNFVNLFKQNNN